ncbi:MAG: TAXI family TRAP transporter solute-binding subunit [Rhodocyclaceae bacterium]|nr:TAXI family TRAP transporter solute-binding subunit [Rhodocyclaceae bacterium]
MKYRDGTLRLLLGLLCCVLTPLAWSADRTRMVVAGSERSTNAQVVRDIAKHVTKPADIELDVRHSAGSADALMRLREGGGQQFAVLQADIAEAFLGAAARGNIEAGQLLAPVRVIAPLHEEGIYFIVRSDSPLNFVHEIENARINVGQLHGDTALTVATLYRLMFDAALPEQQTSFNSHQNALVKLTEQLVDVVALVAPQPARILADMKPEARRFVKLLKFDPNHPRSGGILKVYSARAIPAASYPNLLDEDLPALAVKIYLVSHGRNDAVQARFANAWCQNLPRLRAEGHPGLRGLELALPQPVSGWNYSKPFERELRACIEGKRAPAESSCSQEDRALGLCT